MSASKCFILYIFFHLISVLFDILFNVVILIVFVDGRKSAPVYHGEASADTLLEVSSIQPRLQNEEQLIQVFAIDGAVTQVGSGSNQALFT